MKSKKINKLLIASVAIFSVLIIVFTYLHVKKFNYIFRSYEYSMQNYNIPSYDYMYYVALKSELGEEYDESKFEIKISNYIDDESGLLFFMDKNEDKDTKLLLTGKLLKLSKKIWIEYKKN